MTWPVPPKIDAPSLADFPFIRIKYERLLMGQPGETIDDLMTDNDDDFSHHFFCNPASVAYEQAVALEMLSNETFSGLCHAMDLAYYDKPFRSKDELSVITAQEFDSLNKLGADDCQATFEQVMSYILFKAKAGKDVRWDRIAEIYNNAQESQQRALAFYFDRCENRDLLDLLSTRAPAIELPAEFTEIFERKIVGTEAFVIDADTQRLTREDIFMNRFEVALIDSQNFMTLAATGPTLTSALGKAISNVRDSTDLMLYRAHINRDGIQIAEGKIVYTTGTSPSFPDCDPRINWKSMSKSEDASFNKALYAAEKALGIQWSKVQRLEEELGM